MRTRREIERLFRSAKGRLSACLRRTPVLVWAGLAGCVALGGGGWLAAHLLNRPAAARSTIREIAIERGVSTRQVGALLEREGLIRSALFFRCAAYFSPVRRRIQAGLHDVDGGATTTAILRSLATAKDLSRTVTVPEGLTLREVAGLLEREAGVNAARFVALGTDSGFCREVGIGAGRLEGYLFPETYRLPARADERHVARVMVKQFWKVFDGEMRARAQALGRSAHEVVTLASIVEREAKAGAERPLIAGVFHRRLKVGMKLESDPTTEYALGIRKPRLFYSDLAVDSPYNTYRYPGLPPGPIASPGRASLLAALYPVDAGYLFFVARGDGTHAFSRTKREHDRAKAQIRKDQKNFTAKGAKGAEKTQRRTESEKRRSENPPLPLGAGDGGRGLTRWMKGFG